MEHQIPLSNLRWNSQNLVGRMSDQIRFWELKGKKLTLFFWQMKSAVMNHRLSKLWVTIGLHRLPETKTYWKEPHLKTSRRKTFTTSTVIRKASCLSLLLPISWGTVYIGWTEASDGFFFYVPPLRYKSTSNQPSGRAAPVNIGQSNLLDFPHDYLAMW